MEQVSIDAIVPEPTERNRSDATAKSPSPSGAAVKRPQVTDALVRTFLEEWARVGYSALSLDTVARRAGVGKAALYRRWRSKADMARDIVAPIAATIPGRIAPEDTGTLEGDLQSMLLAMRRLLRHPLVRRILPDFFAALPREPALAAALRPSDRGREAKVRDVVDRAIARGDLSAKVDARLVSDVVMGPLYWRVLVMGDRCSQREIELLARMTAAAIRNC